MPSKLLGFINVLRSHDIRVSPAETLDAVEVVALLGYRDRELLRAGLSQVLAKTPDEKTGFLRCFDRFFSYALPQQNVANADEGRSTKTATDAAQLAVADAALTQLSEAAAADGQQRETLDLAGELNADPALRTQLDTPLLQMLQADDRNALTLRIARAGERVGLSRIQLFTQKGQFTRRILDALGEAHIRGAAVTLEQRASPALAELQMYRDRLRELVKDHVEREYLLHAGGHKQQFMDDILARARLSNIEQHYLQRVHELIRKMAKKLAARYSRQRKTSRRGQLNMNKTLRHSVANDGVLFDIHWKTSRKKNPRILAVCDVSGSVAAYAKFLLLFLYSLYDVLPRVRSFAFSGHLGEVSKLFDQHPVEQAIELVNLKYGGATDYGRSLLDFTALALDDIDSHTTVIILGDARNNGADPRLDLMQSIYQRAGQVIWLNPESRKLWGSGDSEMHRYRSACHYTAECNSLHQLERFIEQLLRSVR